jgi:choice-of-anchor B domain-containing protein
MKRKSIAVIFAGGFLVVSIAGFFTSAHAYSLNLIGRVRFGTMLGSDCWGYTAPDSTEYALMGVIDGIAVVKADSTMQVIGTVPGPVGGPWRDIKTYQNYAYAVSENMGTNNGLMIIDLQFLPDSVHFVKSYISGPDITSHNMTIDTTTGFAYILKSDATGFRVVDLADPENPVELPFVNIPGSGIHDVFARNDTVYVAEGAAGTFSYYNMANKLSPDLIKRFPIPVAGYVHNIWPSELGPYVMTTEETQGNTVKLWDVSDTSNFVMTGEYLGNNILAHNTHIKGNFAYISHYAFGIVVLDISDPANPVQVAHYDTYPLNDDPGFAGCWGAYPFTQNGTVFSSDMEGYLTVFAFDSLSVGADEEIRDDLAIPQGFYLFQNQPNPFQHSTYIRYQLPTSNLASSIQPASPLGGHHVSLKIFDISGRLVETLVDGNQDPGVYQIEWNDQANHLPNGEYLVLLQTPQNRSTIKTVLLR